DLISFWLADLIDERGWGIAGDSFTVMDELRALGREVWFNLGDRDLAWCIQRRRLEDEGASATEALRTLNARIGVAAEVLPMTDGHALTEVNGKPLQEFLIRDRGQGPVESVTVGRAATPGGPAARPSAEALAALADASAIIIGPSNPVISIAPILALVGEALCTSRAPVVMVSPIVGGQVLKGPTDAFMDAEGLATSAAGVAAYYESLHPGMLDGVVADDPVLPGPAARHRASAQDAPFLPARPPARHDTARSVPDGLAVLQTDTRMPDGAARARVAGEALAFAESLAKRR
ncbi:MAG: 2-phospho-L-lactate transferase CofD family protein, partial [Solirubrobacteraceae bacterium]